MREIGTYNANYHAFAVRLKEKYPNIKLIANCDISKQVPNVDIWDFHVYDSPDWFYNNMGIFDKYNRDGPQVFVSEYAVTRDAGLGNLRAAVAEAAFMTGLVRNSDIVTLTSYAPLFVNENDRFWNTDAILYNCSVSAGTPSYYVQKMFSRLTGQFLVSSTLENATHLASVVTLSDNILYITLVC